MSMVTATDLMKHCHDFLTLLCAENRRTIISSLSLSALHLCAFSLCPFYLLSSNPLSFLDSASSLPAGFADIPTGPSCPYIVRRGLLGTAVVPVPQKEPGPEETD